MKKLFTIAIIAMVATAFAAEWKFPGWDKTASVYEAEIAKYEAAPLEQKPFQWTEYNSLRLAKAMIGREIKSFDEVYALANEFLTKPSQAQATAFYYVNSLYMKERSEKNIALLKSTYNFAQIDANLKLGCISEEGRRKNLGVSDDEAVKVMFDNIVKIKGNYKAMGNYLDMLYGLLDNCSMPTDEQLAGLKKINRSLSKNLVGNDKDKWEPVIAKLRTVIASY